jgi:hypothetical protein
MNLNLLQVFQSAINAHGEADGNARLGMARQSHPNLCYRKVVLHPGSSKDDNTDVRRAFKAALTDAFGVSRLNELPPEVKKVLKISDFKEAKDGEVLSSRPLTMRRIRAVMGAVQELAKSTAGDSAERERIENSFLSNFRDVTAVEDALRRVAIASGRQPMKIQMPHHGEVCVPLSALAAYTKGAPAESLAADVDDLQERIQNDVNTGCAIYSHLVSGRACTHSADGERALRHYLAFVALANGKGQKSRMISVPDPNGMVTDYLGRAKSGGKIVRIEANDDIAGSVNRLMFVGDIQFPGAHVTAVRQRDLEDRYRRLAANPFSSRLLRRRPECGTLTVSQMLANVKAEFCRIATVEDDELRQAVQKELGRCDDKSAAGLAEIGRTKSRNDFHTYRCMLYEFQSYLQIDRGDLDHPEARIGDEIVLTADEIAKFTDAVNNDAVLSPRGRRGLPPQNGQAPAEVASEMAIPKFENSAAAHEWRRKLIEECGGGNLKAGFLDFVRCMENGCMPPDRKTIPEYDRRKYANVHFKMEDVPDEFKDYFDRCDNDWFANLAWYIKNGGKRADESVSLFRRGNPGQSQNLPVWDALCRGVIDRGFPGPICRALAALFVNDNPQERFDARVAVKHVRDGVSLRNANDMVAKAASSIWGFGTFDLERILRYVEDCGYCIDEISVEELQKLSTIAALNDFRLEETPMFIQRQTGKYPSDVTTDDLVRLFKLMRAGRLNDKGMNLSGSAGDVAAVLKGDKLPSMTAASGKDVSGMLSVMRRLSGGRPGDCGKVEFLGQKVSFRLTASGAMVFSVAGFEFRAAKTAREFVEIFEDDAIGHIEQFGARVVLGMLPQIRGAELSADAVECSRSRELCLRYIKGTIGVDPVIFASVGTKEIFRIAEGVIDDRYRLRTGQVAETAVKTMLDRHVDRSLMTSMEAAELCSAIQDLENVPGVTLAPIVRRSRSASQFRNEDVKKVHELLAELVLDFNTLDFDRSYSADPDARVIGIMRKHIGAMVAVAKDPSLVATFPQSIVGGFRNVIEIVGNFMPKAVMRRIPDESFEQTILFLLDNVGKTRSERERAVDAYINSTHRNEESAPSGLIARAAGTFKRFTSFLFGDQPQVDAAVDSAARRLDRNVLLDALDRMSRELVEVDARIEQGVAKAMEIIQQTVAEALSAGPDVTGSGRNPIWSMEFEEIVGNAMTDSGSGYGKFMCGVLSTYFTQSSILDQRKMMASLIRHVDSESSDAMMLGALFKGAGPLLQKMLQGMPPSALGPELSDALKDMKSNLLPIPDEFVKAGMRRIIDRSQGRIKSIEVQRSLGAASVGQAFLCRMFTDSHPEGEECVVKLLRPTVKTAIARERSIFEAAAAGVPGMSQTFAGQLARILEELDFTLEAANINFGRNVYESPAYFCQESIFSGGEVRTVYMDRLHSMEVHPLVTPTMDCLVLKKAPGETYDRYMAYVRRRIAEVKEGMRFVDGSYVADNIAEMARLRRTLCSLYDMTLLRQKYLIDLTKKWVQEGLFGNGFYHGDLHAGNIMTDGNGLTVIDFGNATHLTELERAHVLRMISAALVGWNDMFESSFKMLLSDKGREEYDSANMRGDVSRDLAEVLHKGSQADVGMRIAAALMILQRHGIEVPGSIYNFNQCQMRLGGTVDEMCMLLNELSMMMSQMSFPVIDHAETEGDAVSTRLISLVSDLTKSLAGSAEHPFLNGAEEAIEALQEHVFEYGAGGVFDTEVFGRFLEELDDPELCKTHIYPFIERLTLVPGLVFESDEMLVAKNGSHRKLAKNLDVYRTKEQHTLEERAGLLKNIIAVVKEMLVTASRIQGIAALGRPESFLMAVGDGISDSLYSVRTTLGNITSVKLMNEQSADRQRSAQRAARMRDSDQLVQVYVNAHNGAGMEGSDVQTIKESARHLYLPFDLPGLGGNRDWRNDERKRIKVYETLDVVISRLLADLERRGVLNAQSTPEKRKHAVCIAMRYLADREGELFEAFGGADNRERMRILAEVNVYNSRRLPTPIDQADIDARQMRDQCIAAAVLFLFNGGVQATA